MDKFTDREGVVMNGQQQQQQQQHHQSQHKHHHLHQQQQHQQQRQHLSSSSSSCSSNCGSNRCPLISSNPAFRYFQDKDQLDRGAQKKFEAQKPEEAEAGNNRSCGNNTSGNNTSNTSTDVKSSLTMPNKYSVAEESKSKTLNKNGNKIHVLTQHQQQQQSQQHPQQQQQQQQQQRQQQQHPTISTTPSLYNDLNNNNDNNSNKCQISDAGNESGKVKVSVAKLIKRHHEEIQSSSQIKRFSGNDRCRWFFRSLRGERSHKSADEGSGSESGSAREAECSRCRLASLTTNQLEESVEKLRSSLEDKSSRLECLEAELKDRGGKLRDLQVEVDRMSTENRELKSSINRLISEQMFGRRVLMTSDPENRPTSGGLHRHHQQQQQQQQQQAAGRLQQGSTLGNMGKSACLSQPSLNLLATLGEGDRPGFSTIAKNSTGHSNINNNNNNNNNATRHVFSPIRSVGDNEDYDEDDDEGEAGKSASLEKTRRHYPVIKPKPIFANCQTPRNRRLHELSLADREWHSSDGFSSAPRVARVAATPTSTAAAFDDYSDAQQRRSAKSSLELDDSLCVEYPNRTFRQQMECLKGVTQSVESLKSDPAGRRFKARRRRGTVAAPGESLFSPGLESPWSNNTFTFHLPISSTRKLSSYSSEQQSQLGQQQHHHRQHPNQQLQLHQQHYRRQDQLDGDCHSEAGPYAPAFTRHGNLVKANSTDFLHRWHCNSNSINHHRHRSNFQNGGGSHLLGAEQRSRPLDLDPTVYYLQPSNSNSNSNKENNNSKGSKKLEEKIAQLTKALESLKRERCAEQRSWLDEKMRVIEYQKKLQDAYLQVKGHCSKLELELRQLRNA